MRIFTPLSILDDSFFKEIKKIETTINVVVAYGQIINQRIIDLPKNLTINVHASFLPRWRGAAPIQRSILSGDKFTGVTIMKVTKGLDEGPIILQEKIQINSDDSYETLNSKIKFEGFKLLLSSLRKILLKNYTLKAQSDKDATYAYKISKIETRIDWDKDSNLIMRKIKAFNPFPGAWTEFHNSDERLKIFDAKLIEDCKNLSDPNISVGTINDSLIVKCSKGYIKIIELQKQGKKKVKSKEFLNGFRIKDKLFK